MDQLGPGKQPKELSQDTIRKQVSETVPTTSINLDNLRKRVELFRAGQVRHRLPFWESLTNDPFILDAIKHHHIEFEAEYPTQTVQPNKINFSAAEIMTIDAEIAKLITKEVLQVTNRVPDGFISNIFIRPKKDGAFSMILNLKPLSRFVDYHHFKMDTFRTALKLIRPGCFMASVDLKDAYYSIPIEEEDRKLLIFQWKRKYYQFTCLPNGLSSAPRNFLLKSSSRSMLCYVLLVIHVWDTLMTPYLLVRDIIHVIEIWLILLVCLLTLASLSTL